ncbi:MAG: tRNA 2-thiouridine synthesizing protein A [Candidatus Endobugula sp.]|jgi:tRNA 2-thiouridine synthesizing protein A
MIIAKTIDAKRLSCPLPLLKAKQGLHQIESGEYLLVLATDGGSVRDFHSFIDLSEHSMIKFTDQDGHYQYLIQKA